VPEHFIRGGEHFVRKHEGPAALVSYRLAQLVGSGVRGGLGLGARADEHRWRFRRTAGVLCHHPTTVDLDSPATSARGRSLVVCSLEPWDEVWRRNQFLVRELLALDPDRRILFVEPAFDVLHERRRGAGRRHVKGLRPLGTDGRVTRLEPLKLLPRRFGPLADRLRDRQVTRAVDRLGFYDPALWVNDPSYASLAAATTWPSLYDITDDWTEADHARTGSAAARDEKRLFERCDAVVVCSAGLAATRRAARDDLVVIPNAVDTDHLLRPRPRPDDLPADDVAVYVGSLHDDRIDVALVERLATALPRLTILLVGPDSLSETSRARLRRRTNVVLAGRRPYELVPAYLQHASVVIVPHRVTPFTESLDPIKLYESLALGRTTVATPVAGFRDAGDPVVVASGEAFVDAVRDALAERPADRPADVPSWPDRAEAFEQALTAARGGERHHIRVVYYDHCARLSGGELALARLLPALRNVEPLVLLGEHGPLEELLRERQIPTEVLLLDEDVANTSRTAVTPGAVGLRRLTATAHDIRRLAQRLRELEPDLLHTNSLKGALLGGVAGRLAGVPVLWHVRDRIATDYMPRPAVILVRAASWVLPSAVIANSASTRRTLGRRHRADVIGSPIVYDLVEASAHLGTSTMCGPLRVAMVGRLAPWKGQDVFLEAFARAFPDGDEQAVLAGSAMFGEDVFEAQLRARTVELGIADRVEFTGFVDDVHALLAGCDVLVHASIIAEPFGQVVIEGLAAGLPVIATDSGGPSEIITDGVDGLLCGPGDVGLMARLLRRLANDPAERERLGAAGLRRAADFRPEVIAGLVEHTYRRVLVR
jgi:glycosyltransferase involved in cell wall biosynthesis